LNSHNVIRAEK